MENQTIEEIIRDNLTFIVSSPTDWNRLYCEVCGDGSRTKGPRAGFLLNGNNVNYHCFNCGVSTSWHDDYDNISKKMLDVFKAFNIPLKDILRIVNMNKPDSKKHSKSTRSKLQFKSIPIPDHFYKLTDAIEENIIAKKAIEFVENGKHIKITEYPFYLSTSITKNSDPKEIHMAKSLRNRLIIPAYYNENMIYYIARSLDPGNKKKYLNAPIPKVGLLYGMENLYKNQNNILFVTEGFFDSFHLKGVAVLENYMTKSQIEVLNSSPRKKVVVPDRHGDSCKLAEQAVSLGWGLSLPEWGDCKDVCESIIKYGKLYTIDSIMKNIYENERAKLQLNRI